MIPNCAAYRWEILDDNILVNIYDNITNDHFSSLLYISKCFEFILIDDVDRLLNGMPVNRHTKLDYIWGDNAWSIGDVYYFCDAKFIESFTNILRQQQNNLDWPTFALLFNRLEAAAAWSTAFTGWVKKNEIEKEESKRLAQSLAQSNPSSTIFASESTQAKLF